MRNQENAERKTNQRIAQRRQDFVEPGHRRHEQFFPLHIGFHSNSDQQQQTDAVSRRCAKLAKMREIGRREKMRLRHASARHGLVPPHCQCISLQAQGRRRIGLPAN
jgi:hypothetical protein